MSTILKDTKIQSQGLMTGTQTQVTLFGSQKKGIRFFLGSQQIDANISNVVSTEHCTVLGKNGAKVMLVEHFMAALAFCSIDSLDVCLDNFEMPILDGSSLEWIKLFQDSGVSESPEHSYVLTKPVIYEEGKTKIIILPSEDLSITYAVDFKHPDLHNRWFTFKENPQQIIEARTFGYLNDLENLQKAGFAKGVSIENTIGLSESSYTTELRSEFEPIKHKILDLIGDFNLTGINPLNLKATIIAQEAGHAVHCKCAKLLKDAVREK